LRGFLANTIMWFRCRSDKGLLCKLLVAFTLQGHKNGVTKRLVLVLCSYRFWLPPTEPCALRSTQPLKVSTRDFFWGKGGRCVWLMTYHPCSAECQENPGP